MERSRLLWLPCLAALALTLRPAAARADDDLDDLRQKAITAAVAHVAPSVVMIETSGGTEIVSTGPRGPRVRKGVGPTTGLVVGADGWVISSAFNFANKPTSIIVSVPGQPEKFVARVVATDHTRMLTLLKLEKAPRLAVPAPTPKAEVRIGQTAIAVGRTLAGDAELPPSVSVGIVSATNRIWGRLLQTDAKVSPVNYGGPLIDLQGRVLGVLVPADPRAEGETAGIGWYDSGIGFAAPLEDLMAVLPRMQKGEDLKKGLLGITTQAGDPFTTEPVVATVVPGSAADKAGVKPGDRILAVDGKEVRNLAQLQHQLGYRYEGDSVALKLKRGEEVVSLPAVAMIGAAAVAFNPPFLGILPMRDDPVPGVEVRYVYPKSAADKADLKAGDRITQVGQKAMGMPESWAKLKDRDQLLALVEAARPGQELKLEVTRKGGEKKEELTVTLGDATDEVPAELPQPSTRRVKKEEPKEGEKKPEVGFIKRQTPAQDHSYWVYVPESYNPAVAHGLVLWLHPLGRGKDRDVDDFVDAWSDFCEKNHVILVGPRAEGETGWTPGDADFIQDAVKAVMNEYTVDKRRVVAHGMGQGGQMAYYLAFNARGLIRGVAVTGAPLTGAPKEKVANQPLAFFLVAGGKDPIKDAIKDTATRLREAKYPCVHREIPNMGHQYLDEETLKELVRWIDSLDRI